MDRLGLAEGGDQSIALAESAEHAAMSLCLMEALQLRDLNTEQPWAVAQISGEARR